MSPSPQKGVATACLLGASLVCGTASDMKIVAHRGASQDAPENTIAAFQLAWHQGTDAIEGDFRLTKDGMIVCMHDETTERTAGISLDVAQSRFAELRKLDVGFWKGSQWAGEKIPSIEEVLGTVPKGKQIFIEIKSGPELVDPLQRAIASSSLVSQQIVVISFNATVISEVKKRLPAVKAYWLIGFKEDKKSGRWKPSLGEILNTLKTIQADGLDSQAHALVDAAFAGAIRAAALALHVWTVDDPVQARYYAKLGVDSITTNRPGWLRAQLDRGEQAEKHP
jgi:glycerophosphoryl diester phosphodiesterase